MLPPTAGVHVELGDGSCCVAGGDPSTRVDLRGAVGRRVLAVLALEQRAVSRDELGDAVWGDDLPRTWETALRGAVHQVRKAAVAVAPGGPDVVRTAFGCYQLDPSVGVDLLDALAGVESAERLLASGEAAPALAAAASAARVLAEPLLPGLEGEWLDRARRRFDPFRGRSLLALSAAATACGDHGRAVDAAEAAVALDPFQEQAHRQLMTAHAAGGDRGAALVAYRRCRELLAQELGVLPSDQTEAVRESLAHAATPVTPVVLPGTLDTHVALAGRAEELGVLERRWATVATLRVGGVVAISGAAGTGKSRLGAEAAVLAFRSGAAVAHGRFDPDDLGAFTAFREVLGQLGVAWPPPGGAGGAERAELFGAARQALASAAAGRGLVVVLDDAHWADRPSLALLAELAAEPVPGLLVVVTARDDWVPPALAELLDTVERIDLAPLGPDGTEALVLAWSGSRPSDVEVELLQRRTGGNPYFLTALLHHLEERRAVGDDGDVASFDDGDLPESVPDLVAEAIARAGAHAGGLALQAAVLGDDFRSDLLAEVGDLPSGVVAAALERLAHVRVLGRAGGDGRRFRFVHALVRRSVLDAAEPDAVRAAHRAAARVLASEAPSTPELLGHLLEARDDATIEEAVELGIGIAADLVDAGAPDEAVTILESLAAWLDEASSSRPALRGALLMGLAAAEVSRDRLAEGRRALIGAAELAVEQRDPSILRTGIVLLRPPTAAEHDPGAIDVATRLLALAEPASELDASVRCWLAAEVGAVDVERSASLAAQALADARALGNPVLHHLAGLTWHLMARGFTAPDERRAELDRLLALPLPAGRRRADVTVHVFLAGDCLEVGDRRGAEAAVAAALEGTSPYERTHLRWLALRNLVLLRALDGDLDGADDALVEVFEVAGSLPIPEAVTLPLMQQVLNRYHQRRLPELQPLVAAFAASAPPLGFIPVVAGWIDAEVGAATAPESVDRGVTAALALPRDAGWLGVTAIAVEAAAAVGHPRTAELAARLEPLSGRHAVIVTIGYLGAVDRYLALAARARGDHERAAALFDRAQAQHRAVGAACYLERTARELATEDPAA